MHMSEIIAEQLALDGLAPRKRRKRAPATHVPAERQPIAQVVLDVQATHLGRTFDYLIDEKYDETAVPGVMVRVRFGGQRVNGIIWNRVDTTTAPTSSLRYIERVVSPRILVSASMRRDITLIADAYGGTAANIIRLAIPPRVARVDSENMRAIRLSRSAPSVQSSSTSSHSSTSRSLTSQSRDALEKGIAALNHDYDNATALSSAIAGNRFDSFVMDMLPGALRWARDLATLITAALNTAKAVVIVLPTMREVNDLAYICHKQFGLKAFDAATPMHGSASGDFALLSAALSPEERYRTYCTVAAGDIRCVIGTRAAMYAPVEGSALFAVVEDEAYQYADGMMPYANARGVLQLRARSHRGVFLAMANARSPLSQWEITHDQVAGINSDSEGGSNSGVSSDVNRDAHTDSNSDENAVDTGHSDISDSLMDESSARQDASGTGSADHRTGAAPQTSGRPPTEPSDAARISASTHPCEKSEQNMEAHSSCETPVTSACRPVRAYPAIVKEQAPWIRWLNREELNRLADPTVGSRVPHFAVRIVAEALEHGPVLFSIPQDGVAEVLSCAKCHRQARCARCTGPLLRSLATVAPRCGWCGAASVNWKCPDCGNERMRVVRVGSTGTAEQLHALFRTVPMIISSAKQPSGIVETVSDTPMIVIAAPGAEPRVVSQTGEVTSYRAVVILDAWTSLYAPGVDSRLDTLNAWMRAVSLCVRREAGGQALLIGETDPALAKSLIMWDSSILAAQELRERSQTGMAPVLFCACVWGRREAVMDLLHAIGVLDGRYAFVTVHGTPMPAVLGPVPIPAPRTVDERELEATRDRVKAVIRVDPSRRAELAVQLRNQVAKHVASRTPGELRFHIDPKDLL